MDWYQKPLSDVFGELASDNEAGITQVEATSRLGRYGRNILPQGREVSWYEFLLRQFRSPLVYILIIGAFLTILLREWVDTTVILLAVAVNVAVGFWQEFQSSNILEKLQAVVKTYAFVIRHGNLHEINAEMLVPGDVIVLKAGNKVPADARVFEAHNMEVNESILTGESAPVRKRPSTLKKVTPMGDRRNMVHMGTLVSRGEGRAVVVATGGGTAFGKIALLTQSVSDDMTPLQVRMGKLGKLLAILIGIASIAIFIVGLVEGHTFVEMVTTAIAVAVAAIPEGLPAAISIILAVSAQKILKQKGVVKRLIAAEALGSASVICTDKTGTLTEGRMMVQDIILPGGERHAEHAREILALANEAVIEEIEEKKIVKGETTDQAKLQNFLDHGGDIDALNALFPRVSLLTFDPSQKYIASLHRSGETEQFVLYANGAPEVLLECSNRVYAARGGTKALTEKEKKKLHAQYEKLAAKGYRVLGIAERTFRTLPDGEKKDLEDRETQAKLVGKLVFVGFAAIRDPIREDVRGSIKQARAAGVRIIMMTGDHLLTARAVANELGFAKKKDTVFEGSIIEELSDEELDELVGHAELFARVDPEHKMRVVAALERCGEVVAMTGDGINDAPALKSADIGVAVGSGTDIAKAASDLVLLNDSFSIIVESIRQGRVAFDNIRKVTVFLLVGSFTELILIMSGLVFRIPLPLTAVQILWTNLVEDTLPNVALAFEPGEEDIMKRPPNKRSEPVLDRESKIIVFAVGIITDLALVGIFLYFYYLSNFSLEHTRTIVFAGLGLDTFFYIFSIKNLHRSIFSYNVLNNMPLVIATVIGVGLMLSGIYVPWLNTVLETVPLGMFEWTVILILFAGKVTGVEFVKWWFIHRKRAPLPAAA